MISKELLSELFNRKIESYKIIGSNVIIETNDNRMFQGIEINIYELAHTCKEWAVKKGFQVVSGFSDEHSYRDKDDLCFSEVRWHNNDDVHREYYEKYFTSYSEQEAVIQACQWILDNKVKNES